MNNINSDDLTLTITSEFPSPAGVNYYEFTYRKLMNAVRKQLFPSPAGVNYYEYYKEHLINVWYKKGFPSPAGVNYYECYQTLEKQWQKARLCFRPQQGLTIMNQRLFEIGKPFAVSVPSRS